MAEDIDGALGIRATIDAADVQKGANDFIANVERMRNSAESASSAIGDGFSFLKTEIEAINAAIEATRDKLASISSAMGNVAPVDSSAIASYESLKAQIEALTKARDELQTKLGATATGDVALDGLGDQLTQAKAKYVELSETIEQQRAAITELKGVVLDCSDTLKEAQDSGNTQKINEAKEALNKAKDDLARYRLELEGFTAQQREAKGQVDELSKALKESQATDSPFEKLVGGAETMAQKIQSLRENYEKFQESLQNSQNAVDGASQSSANYTAIGNDGVANVANMASDRNIFEKSDETKEKTEAIASALKEIEQAYTTAAATARVAFGEQKNVVAALEEQIKSTEAVMQGAIKAGDMASATEAAGQLQKLESQLTTEKTKLAELQAQSQSASETLKQFGEDSAKLSQRVEEQGTTLGRVKLKLQDLGQGFTDFASGQVEKAKGAISQFTKTIDGMGIPLTSTITNMGKMTKAAWAFVSTPLGAILGAIVLALKAVHTWLNKSAEGQKVMAQVSAYFGSIMGSITDIVIAFGNYLFKTFTGSNKAVNEFTSNFVTAFKTGFSAVKNLVVGFGTVFKGVWQIITGEISEGWTTLKAGVSQMGDGISDAGKYFANQLKVATSGIKAAVSVVGGLFTDKELGKSLTKSITEALPNAKKAANYALESMNLAKEEGEAKARTAKLDKEIAEQREKIYSLTGKEKEAALEKAKQLTKEKYYGKDIIDQKTGQKKHENGLYDIQKKQYDNLVNQHKLHTQTLQTIKAERQARIALLQTDATAAASTRMLTRMEEANKKSMKNAAKSGLNKSNAVTSAEGKVADTYNTNNQTREQEVVNLENAIADARIAAMQDGYARTKAEREKQNQDELDKIKQQEKAAVKAEEKRQKAEFDAEQAVIKAKGGKVTAWSDKMVDTGAIDKIKKQYEELYKFTEKKQQRKNVDSLAQTYDKQEAERQDKLNKLRNDIEDLQEQLSKATSAAEKSELSKMLQNAQAQQEWVEKSKDAWNTYYKEYGTFVEKIKAINDQFSHDTIGMDENSPEYKSKQKKRDKDISSATADENMKNFDWVQAFGSYADLSTESLKKLAEQLKEIIELDDTLNAADKSKFAEKYNAVQEQIAKNKGNLGGIMGNSWIGNVVSTKAEQKEKQRQRQETADKLSEKAEEKKKASADAEKARADSENSFNDFLKKSNTGLTAKDFLGKSQDEATEKALGQGMSEGMKPEFQDLFGKFKDSTDTAKNTAEDAEKASSAADTAKKEAKEGATAGASLAMTGAIIKGVNANVQSANELIAKYGDPDSKFAKGFADFAESSQEATAAFESLSSGDIMGTVLHLSNAFEKLFDIFGWGSGNMEDYLNALEQYQKLDAVWTSLIKKKSEYLSMTFGDEAKKTAQELVELSKADLQATRNIGKQYAGAWERHKHSAAYEFDKKMKNKSLQGWTWADVSKAAGASVTSMTGLFDLTAEQLTKIKVANTNWWTELDEDTRNYLDKIIDASDTLDDALDSALEKITGITFDNMKSSFMECLSDMSKGADDFVSEFQENIRTAIIGNMIGTEVETWMKDFTSRYQTDIQNSGGTLTEEKINAYKRELQEASNKFMLERDSLVNNLGIGATTKEEQQKNGYSTASEESIEVLSGRALAQQMALYEIRDLQTLNNDTLSEAASALNQVVNIESKRTEYYDESIEIQRTSVTHLANIAKNTNELYQMNERLAKIEKNTRNI